MRKQFFIILSCLLNCMIISCGTGSNLQDNNGQSIETIIKRVQKRPDDQGALRSLENTYHSFVNEQEARIRDLSDDTTNGSSEKIVETYKELQHLYEVINTLPAAANSVHPTDYSSQIMACKKTIVTKHYQQALALMDKGTKNDFREAYRQLKAVVTDDPGNEQAKQKMQDARIKGSLVVEIQLFNGPEFSVYQSELEDFNKTLVNDLAAAELSPFVIINNTAAMKSFYVAPDEMIRLQFTSLDIGATNIDKNTRTINNTGSDNSGRRTSSARVPTTNSTVTTITTTRTTTSSTSDLYLSVYDAEDKFVEGQNLSAQQQWTTESTSYTGDSRSLSASDATQTRNNLQARVPSKQQMVADILNQLHAKIFSYLKKKYSAL
ncbi:MAG: hypothetical protein ACHQEB_05635 [Chitinophagales bacterium]